MSKTLDITFTNKPKPSGGLVIVLVGTDVTLARGAESVDPKKTLPRAAGIAGFSGKPMTKLDVVAPEGSPADRILLVGLGKADAVDPNDWMRAGGVAAGELRRAESATVYLDVPGCEAGVEEAVGFAAGMVMRAYSFDTYKTMRGNGDEAETGPAKVKVRIAVSEPAKAKKAFDGVRGVLDGVALARDLVNEPANILGPIEFAARAKALERLGVDVEILTEKEMKKLGMGALLGVAQGSARPPRLAIMQWKGGKAKDKPVAFIGKGVVFDTGGISIKPAGGMESMKGDMGGAAAVTGLMQALAARKARVNAVGIIGIVENMPDGKAQRPGDIVTTMSGQTVEVINTDAEGRLVLADALWYCQNRFKPQCMINLATLTGAVIVALGHHHAGLFSNNDELSARLTEAGVASSEKLWRLPLGPDYDKLLESKFADMKNVGGRPAGSIIAAQFLQRFVNGTPWAHLDIAGTAMSAPQTEVNRSWASGFGVRLLNTFVEAHYER